MLRRMMLGLLLASVAGTGVAQAQTAFPVNLIPKRSSLERLGLERHWYGVVPMAETEKVLRISLTSDMLFVQTDSALIHAFHPESGKLLWSSQLGQRVGYARGVATNSRQVFVTNGTILHALDKGTGRKIWTNDFGIIPTSPPAASDDYVVVGLASGMLTGIKLTNTDDKGVTTVYDKPVHAWNWSSAPPITTRPIVADREVIFTGSDGLVHLVMKDERTVLFRFKTGGQIGDGFGTHDTRLLLVPSSDNALYAVDIFTAKRKWLFASGAPVRQAPMVADNQVFVINEMGELSEVSIEEGRRLWTLQTSGGRLLSASPRKIYLRSENLDLFTVDRATGKIVASPIDTLQLAGLDLRDYGLDEVNRFNDRLYFATASGMLLCFREAALADPVPIRNPKGQPFGYVPPEGIKTDQSPLPPTETNSNVDLTVNPLVDPTQGGGNKEAKPADNAAGKKDEPKEEKPQ